MTADHRIALVLGATGGVGGETAAALARRGWRVRALTRRVSTPREGIEWIVGDAQSAGDIARAASGAAIIVHAVNPPGYRDWERLALPMLDNTIAAAKAEGARILLPGTIYNFGPDAFPVLHEDAPQNPRTRKGAIRVEMERRLEAAARDGARALILRAGDFFGPRPGNSWLSQGMVKPGARLASITEPLRRPVGHAWAYLPDVGGAFARLADRERDLRAFERLHFAGHWLQPGEMTGAIREAVGRPAPVHRFPWGLLPTLGLFNTTLREMREMAYLWAEPARLDNTRLLNLLGEEPHTPLNRAVAETLEALKVA